MRNALGGDDFIAIALEKCTRGLAIKAILKHHPSPHVIIPVYRHETRRRTAYAISKHI